TNVWATTLNTGGTSNRINITSVQGVAGYPAVFRIIKYTTFNSNSFFVLGSVPNTNTVGFLTNDPASSTIVLVLTDGPKALTWTGSDATHPTYWDASTTTNWLAFGATPTTFNAADTAIFDNTSSVTNVDIREVVVPSAVTNGGTRSYTFVGTGAIGG